MKKVKININDLFELSGSEIYNPDSFSPSIHVSIDSRNIRKNSIFFAIKGEQFDGHNFILDAVKAGAETIVIEKQRLKDFDSVDKTIVTVEDTTLAYGELATTWRKKLSAKIIALTGSNGKTSTKDMLTTILGTKYKVKATVANNNNHIGAPLTIFSANENDEVLIVELGTNHFGEIEYTVKITQPDIALITNIGDSHLEFLKNVEGVLEEKEALFKYTKENNGKIFINTDDRLLKNIRKKYTHISFGLKGDPQVKGQILSYTDEGNPNVVITNKDKSMEFLLPLCGSASARNFLACAAICLEMELTKIQISKGVKQLVPSKGRLLVKKYKNFILIDDTYNSNPTSMENAIEVMRKIKKYKNRIVICGDMFELGKPTLEKHINLYKTIKKCRINEVYTIGKMMRYLSLKMEELGIETKHFRLKKSLINFTENMDLNESVILVKGSRGMKMEEVVEIIDKRGN